MSFTFGIQQVVLLVAGAAAMLVLCRSDRVEDQRKAQRLRFLGYTLLAPVIAWATVSGMREKLGADAVALVSGMLLGDALFHMLERRQRRLRAWREHRARRSARELQELRGIGKQYGGEKRR